MIIKPEVKANRSKRLSSRVWILVFLALLLLFAAIALLTGRYPTPGLTSIDDLQNDPLAQQLVWNLRLPRLLTSILLGVVLSAAGMVFQMIFSNPLVEPGFLGVSQGAAFGASLAIITMGGTTVSVQGCAAAFALGGLGLSYLLAHRIRYGGWVLRLVLAGIAVSALFSAGLGFLKYIADPYQQLPLITFWLLGSLSSITWAYFLRILPATLVCLTLLFVFRWRLNVLSLSEETAFSLGLSPRIERTLILVAAVIGTAAVISVSGMVGWVGLIVPHIVRRLVGSDARIALPTAMLAGGSFTLVCDTVARTLMAGEIPLGILTSFLGASIFLALMIFKPAGLHK